MTLMVDPPGGNRYGFPKPIKNRDDYEQLLRDSGYPEEDIPMALKYSWWFSVKDSEVVEKKDGTNG